MDERQMKLRAADTILRKGVRVPIVSPPLLLRIFGMRRMSVTLRQPSMGGLIMMSRIVTDMGLDPEQFSSLSVAECYRLVERYGDRIVRILAIGILRYWPLVYLNRPLAAWLRWRIEPSLLSYALHLMLTLNDTADFIVSIRSITHEVSYLGPMDQGSQQAGE